jgi:hypothetical protein
MFMGHKSIRGELGLPSLQELWQNCFGIPAKGAECTFEHIRVNRTKVRKEALSQILLRRS